jgi:hypothetical protein
MNEAEIRAELIDPALHAAGPGLVAGAAPRFSADRPRRGEPRRPRKRSSA